MENKLTRIVPWFWSSFWPFIILTILFSVHLIYTHTATFDSVYTFVPIETFNKLLSLISSVIGFVIVVKSISTNLLVLKGESLIQYFKSKLDKSPLKKRDNQVIEPVQINGASTMPSPTVKGMVSVKPTDIDSLLIYVNHKFKCQEELLKESEEVLKTDLAETNLKLSKEVSERSKQIDFIESKLISIAGSDVDQEIFGILLVLFGSYLNLY
jgi:hypothetical protein